MRRTATTSIIFSTIILLAISCQKEEEIYHREEGMTICAESEAIGTDSKTEMAYKYDVLWSAGDKICVKNSEQSAEFTLIDGEGTTNGTFSSQSTISGEVECFYPASMADRVWPQIQQNNQLTPMYCKKTLSSVHGQNFSFSNLGAVLQIVFNCTVENTTLATIEIQDTEKSMCGEFKVDSDGKAVITATDNTGIILDLGEGVTLGKTAKYFNIAIPAGNYQNLILIFTNTSGKSCTFTGGSLNIARNTVGRITLAGTSFTDNITLPGRFTVNENGTQVKFSRGNMYWNGLFFTFEDNQYDIQKTWSTTHINHFYWSKTASAARALNYSDGTSVDDVIFTNATQETANADFTVLGIKGKFRTLSVNEWNYLINTPARMIYKKPCYSCAKDGVIIEGTAYKGVFLYPDNYRGSLVSSSMTWTLINRAGIVYFPISGFRDDNKFYGTDAGYYCSSSINYTYPYNIAHYMKFVNGGCSTSMMVRKQGACVRLVTEY